jgi:hypothetical protein
MTDRDVGVLALFLYGYHRIDGWDNAPKEVVIFLCLQLACSMKSEPAGGKYSHGYIPRTDCLFRTQNYCGWTDSRLAGSFQFLLISTMFPPHLCWCLKSRIASLFGEEPSSLFGTSMTVDRSRWGTSMIHYETPRSMKGSKRVISTEIL